MDPQQIDLVITWVNGQHPGFLQRWAQEFPGEERQPVFFDEVGELLFQLRSVEKYAPWFRRIYVVVNQFDERPAWLNLAHPKVKVVTHMQIFEPHLQQQGALPTFNSAAIESQLIHIPGLSEWFVYANDDCFFGAPVRPSDFFDLKTGRPRILFAEMPIPGAGPIMINSLFWIDRFSKSGALPPGRTWMGAHVQIPLTRRILQFTQRIDPEGMERLALSKRRSAERDISLVLVIWPNVANRLGLRASPLPNLPLPLAVPSVDLSRFLESPAFWGGPGVPPCMLFCLNSISGEQAEEARTALQKRYPLKSQFEV